MYTRLHIKCQYSCHILIKLDILDIFRKIIEYQKFMKTHPVRVQLFQRTDRCTDVQIDRKINMTKRKVTFSNFANEPKNGTK